MTTRAGEPRNHGRRLLVISYYFGSNGPVGGLRWAGIAKYLARRGWNVTVLTAAAPASKVVQSGVHVDRCLRLGTLGDAYRLVRRLAIGPSFDQRFPAASRVGPAAGPPGVLRRLATEAAAFMAFPDEGRGWILNAALHARRVLRRVQPHVVVSSGPPHSAHLVAGMATAGYPARWLVDLRDPWAGPLPKVWESHRRLGTRVFRALAPRLERLVFRLADGVITNTDQLAAALAAKYSGVPIVRVPNGVDPQGLPPAARYRFPGLGIVYAGRLYTGRDLGPVVRGLRILFERYPEAREVGSKVRVAGEADPAHARAFYESLTATGMEACVELLGSLPRVEALDVVSRSRLAVVLAQDQEMQIPAKLYESVAMGIPTLVLAPANSAAGIEGRRVGAMVRDGADLDGIACVLERLWLNGSGERPRCPVPITYDAIASVVDRLFSVNR